MHTVFHMEHNRLTRKLVRALLYRAGRPYSDYYVQHYLQTAPVKIQERIFQVCWVGLGFLLNLFNAELSPKRFWLRTEIPGSGKEG